MSRSQLQEFLKASTAPPRLQTPNPLDIIDTLRLREIRPITTLPGRPLPGLSSAGSAKNRAIEPRLNDKINAKSVRIESDRVPRLRTILTL